MKISELKIPGCFLITPNIIEDERGSFVKTFHINEFERSDIFFQPKEEFFSFSKKNVIRGLHFQVPPYQHNKLVYCPKGKVIDFFCDLRKSSPSYGKSLKVELSADTSNVLYLPSGIAHGFLSLTNNSLMVYKTDCVYNPESDKGLLWSSINLNLDVSTPLLSDRDLSFPSFLDFESPFK